jgi:hypothetical protein
VSHNFNNQQINFYFEWGGKIVNGISAKEAAQILYPAITELKAIRLKVETGKLFIFNS